MRAEVRKRPDRRYISLFFVDRDLADFIPEVLPLHDDVFVTDVYAIENWLVDRALLSRAMRELFHVELLVADETRILNIFEQMLERFYDAIRSTMGWMLVQRRNNNRFHANSIRLEDMFSVVLRNDFSWSISPLRRRKSRLLDACPNNVPVARSVRMAATELRRCGEPKRYVRGKWELWFFEKFLRLLLVVLANNGNNPRSRVQINAKNIVDIIGPRCRTPHELAQFLQRHLVVQAWPRA
jgi:hypothetical protein